MHVKIYMYVQYVCMVVYELTDRPEIMVDIIGILLYLVRTWGLLQSESRRMKKHWSLSPSGR